MTLLIILGVTYALLVIYLFWMLLKRLRREKDANERIYEDEFYRRNSEFDEDDRSYESHINW